MPAQLATPASRDGRRRTLVLCGDRWHPAATVRAGLDFLETAGGDIHWMTEACSVDAAGWAQYRTIVCAKSNVRSESDPTPWLDLESAEALRQRVRAGAGILFVHSGIAGYRELEPMRALAGGTFVRHPDPCEVMLGRGDPHPCAAGISPFRVFDEHYFVDLDHQDASVFLTSCSVHGEQPAGWTKNEGRGRVCVLTPGHFPAVWQQPEFRDLLVNALRWLQAVEC